jgi:hypothetical protein
MKSVPRLLRPLLLMKYYHHCRLYHLIGTQHTGSKVTWEAPLTASLLVATVAAACGSAVEGSGTPGAPSSLEMVL